jgi:hypothetical protein
LRNYIDAKNPDKSHYLRLGVEEAGGLFGLIGNLKTISTVISGWKQNTAWR